MKLVKDLAALFGAALIMLSCASGGDSATQTVESAIGVIELPQIEAEIEVFPSLGHIAAVNSVAFSSCGKYIASGSDDMTIKLWEASTGREIITIYGHTSKIHSVTFSPDDKLILSASYDNIIKLWDAENGNEIRTLTGGTSSIAFSPDGKYFIFDYSEGEYPNIISYVKLFETATGNEIRTFSGASSSIAFTPDGRQIVVGSYEEIKIWDVATGNEIRNISINSYPASIAFSPDGKKIVYTKQWDDIPVAIINFETGQEIRSFSINTSWAESAVFSPDGKYVFVGSGFDPNDERREFAEISLVLLDVETGKEVRSFTGHKVNVASVAFSPDGKQVISGSGDHTIKLWDVQTGNEIRTFTRNTYFIRAVAFSPDGKQFIACTDYNSDRRFNNYVLNLWDVETGRIISTFTGHQDGITSVAFSSDGKQILSASRDNTIKIWNTSTGQEIQSYSWRIPGRLIMFSYSTWRPGLYAVFSPDGNQIASSLNLQDTILLWDKNSGQSIRTFTGTNEQISSLSFSPDGRYLISGTRITIDRNYVGVMKLWDVSTGRLIRTFSGHNDLVNTVAFSPDSKYILSGSADNTIKLWDVNTGNEVITFSGHDSGVNSVAFNHDGSQVLSGSSDNTVKLWETDTGWEIKTFTGNIYVTSVSFSSNNKIISSLGDGTVRLWDVETGKEIAQFISFSGSDSQLNAASRGLTVETQTASSTIEGEWIVVTPDGYYSASPRGDRYLNVRVNNTVSGIDAYRSILDNPDVVQARLQGLPDPVSKSNITIQQAAAIAPPRITIQSPSTFATTNTGTASLSVEITDQNRPLDSIRVFVNGRPAGSSELASVRGNGLQAQRTSLTVTGNQRTVSFTMNLDLDPGQNRIEVVAFNGYSENRRYVDVIYNAPAGQRQTLPNLWILAIGVNSYDNAGVRLGGMRNLNFAAADARRLVETFKAQEGRHYAQVNSLIIADGESLLPTTENIRRNLSFLDRAGDRDIVILFLAGHGLSVQEGKFFFLPKDAIVTGNTGSYRVDESRAISGDEITAVLEGPGRRLLFIDACQSGGVDSNRMIRSMMESNAFVFAASQGNELSYESASWGGGHGVFTYSVLNALRGAPAALAEGNVSVLSMSGYVRLEVPRQTQNRQNPRLYSLLSADFPLAMIR